MILQENKMQETYYSNEISLCKIKNINAPSKKKKINANHLLSSRIRHPKFHRDGYVFSISRRVYILLRKYQIC